MARLRDWARRPPSAARGGDFSLPPSHRPVMVLPGWDKPAPTGPHTGEGFSCASCRFSTKADGALGCTAPEYEAYMGTSRLVDPATRLPVINGAKMCSDWYEPRED